jgi:hypothetical protein
MAESFAAASANGLRNREGPANGGVGMGARDQAAETVGSVSSEAREMRVTRTNARPGLPRHSMATNSKGRTRGAAKTDRSKKKATLGTRGKVKNVKALEAKKKARARAQAKLRQEKKQLADIAAREQEVRSHLAGAIRLPERAPKQLGSANAPNRPKPAPPGKPIWDIPHHTNHARRARG